jgi:hypothetical protein
MPQNNMEHQESLSRQCNVQLPADLVEDIKQEAYTLTGHKRRGFSDLLAACARYGWGAYQRGELKIERQPTVISYRLVKGDDPADSRSCKD